MARADSDEIALATGERNVWAYRPNDQQPTNGQVTYIFLEDIAEAGASQVAGTAISPVDGADDDADAVHMPMFPLHPENTPPTNDSLERQQQVTRSLFVKVRNLVDRAMGVLDIPLVLIFDIILYLMDVGSDIAAAVVYFQEGHPVWGALTITFVLLPAICWAAVSWVWWYDYRDKDPTFRRMRMVFCVLLLDPLVRYCYMHNVL